nr:putative MCE associated membrane protein [Mycolicibacter nonchromogenicus]
MQRIMDGATGEFYDDFMQRAEPFIDVVKKYRSVSVGTVAEAALESESGEQAQALVSVTVDTTNPDGSEQVPRAWRLRISVQRVGDEFKVSNVEFVP